jgi:hypothetical protein
MPKFPRHPLLPPRSLREFLEIYDYDVCDHAADACVVMMDLCGATGFMAQHERKIHVNSETSNLVIEVTLTLELTEPDRRKAAIACLGAKPMPKMWGGSIR